MIPKIAVLASFLIIAFPSIVYAVPGTISADIDGAPVDFAYDAEGVNVIGLEADLAEIELIFEVQVISSPAILELTFERQVFDAIFDGTDDAFFVIADGDFIDIEEIETTSDSRTLRMELPLGTEEIEVFGTELKAPSLTEPPVVEEPPIVEEPPVVEEPPIVEEPPVVEEPTETTDDTPKTECGPGTVLKNGECVLDMTCGPGTTLVDGTCVLDDSTSSSDSSIDLPPMSSFIYGAVAAIAISLIVMILLGIISRASRQTTTA